LRDKKTFTYRKTETDGGKADRERQSDGQRQKERFDRLDYRLDD
jgi:hypothetical protein